MFSNHSVCIKTAPVAIDTNAAALTATVQGLDRAVPAESRQASRVKHIKFDTLNLIHKLAQTHPILLKLIQPWKSFEKCSF